MFHKYEKTIKRKNQYTFVKIFSGYNNMLCSICILFITSVITKISAITVYQNITSETHKTLNQPLTNRLLTTAIQPTQTHKQINNFNTRAINNNLSKLNHNTHRDIKENSAHNMKANSTLHKYEEEQYKILQKQHPTYLQHTKSHVMNSISENDYLLERNDKKSLNEQTSIAYDDHGRQLMKAKQSDPSLPSVTHEQHHNIKQHEYQPIIDSIINVLGDNNNANGFVEPYNQTDNNTQYEGLNIRRLSTIKRGEEELRSQIPRPPPPPSTITALNRQYNDEEPKPFHLPYEGAQPEELKKINEGEVNNIQNLLHNMYLNEMLTTRLQVPPFQPPILVPTGLHVSGSYKNLKSSRLLNFLRNKRQKMVAPSMSQKSHQRHPQHYGPHIMAAPLHMVNVYPTPLNLGKINSYPQSYQRLSMDQFYLFKPKSLNDINLLQQQQHQYQSMLTFKHKKNKKKHKSIKQNMWPPATYGPLTPTFVGDTYPSASLYPPFVSFNISQLPVPLMSQALPPSPPPPPPPPLLTKRLPFNVNLDVFPIIPPTKMSHRIPRPVRDMGNAVPLFNPTKIKNPFTEYFTIAPATGNGNFQVYHHNYNNQPIRFPGHAQYSNNMMNYTPHPLQMQNYLPFSQPKYQSAVSFPINDCEQNQQINVPSTENVDPRTSPILLNLNVFPKHKDTSDASEQTNPFYANLLELERNTNHETEQQQQQQQNQWQSEQESQDVQGMKSSFNRQAKMEAHNSNNPNQQTTNLAHSDSTNSIGQSKLTAIGLLSTKSPLMQGQGSSKNYDTVSKQPHDSNKNYMINMKITEVHGDNEPNASNLPNPPNPSNPESNFRFPVEDLITFQVQDAL